MTPNCEEIIKILNSQIDQLVLAIEILGGFIVAMAAYIAQVHRENTKASRTIAEIWKTFMPGQQKGGGRRRGD